VSHIEYVDWLKSLKPGDKVCYIRRRDTVYTIDKVKKMTPTGIVRLESGLSTDKEGYHKSSNAWGCSFTIRPITQNVLDEIDRHKAINRLREFNLHSLSKEQLERIVEIIEGVG